MNAGPFPRGDANTQETPGRPIGRGEQGSPAAATEDLELVAEHGLLEIQLVEVAADEQAE